MQWLAIHKSLEKAGDVLLASLPLTVAPECRAQS